MLDYVVVGGGIVGAATARQLLLNRPGAQLALLEKEQHHGAHQTGHNSGVIHSGIYYQPGSLKADLCRRGAQATYAFAAEHQLPVQRVGKLLVATGPAELSRMADLAERAVVNQIAARRLNADELRELEPNIAGLGALLIPETGITDYRAITEALVAEVRRSGANTRTGVEIVAIEERSDRVVVTSSAEERWEAAQAVFCAGLQADRIARLAGLTTAARIVPFRGEYYDVRPERSDLVKHLIYPIPDPELPFLGVHLTRDVHGGLNVGPNAVLGLAREGYPKTAVSPRDVLDMARFSGLWRVARTHWRTGWHEMRDSLSKSGYLARCQRYCPSLALDDLTPREAGIRAQAVLPDGTFVHDFLVEQTNRMVHVINAPSPAATSALPIGEMIAEMVNRAKQ